MVAAGVIAFTLTILMTFMYRLPGFVACIAPFRQVAATLAFVSGYFPVFPSFITLPGIAGIILAIGMGVDANVITAERIREELANGKSIDGAEGGISARPGTDYRRQCHDCDCCHCADGGVRPDGRHRQTADADFLCIRCLYGRYDFMHSAIRC